MLPAVSAIVLEVGGVFQHAMVVCREFGVPAVYAAAGATQRLRPGQQVTVDGARGWVLAAGDDQPAAGQPRRLDHS
jgi:phosphohistidine swiveling domain-containing protein